MPWTFNASSEKKTLADAVAKKREEYKGQNYMDNQLDIIQPIVDVIVDKFGPLRDEQVVDVNVSKGETGGVTGIAINIVIH